MITTDQVADLAARIRSRMAEQPNIPAPTTDQASRVLAMLRPDSSH